LLPNAFNVLSPLRYSEMICCFFSNSFLLIMIYKDCKPISGQDKKLSCKDFTAESMGCRKDFRLLAAKSGGMKQ
jgi:hypothetical protein